MRPGMPTALFTTGEMSLGRQRQIVAIGRTEQNGPICCYQLLWTINSSGHQLTYLYTGNDRYQLWRRYYQALAEAEKEVWQISKQAARPKVSEVEQLEEQ
jgi:hypothetical protein